VSTSARRCVALATLVVLALALPAGATSTRWSPARLLRLPVASASLPQGYLPALACPAAGSCVAAGDYQDGANVVHGLTVSSRRGVWSRARAIAPPPGAASPADLTPEAVACGAVGDCLVVGSYSDATGAVQAFVDREVKGAWRGARAVALPANAAVSAQVAGLRAVACASATSCAAVGSYVTSDPPGAIEGLVVVVRAGSFSAREVSAPGAANFNPRLVLTQIACARAGSCVAAGTYLDADGATHAIAASASLAPVGAALAPPSDVSAYPGETVGALACVRSGACVVLGTYETSAGRREGYVASSVRGKWQRADELVMPPGAGANPDVFSYGFAGLACASPGDCAAGGQYVDAQGAHQGFLVDEVAGRWRAATELALPVGAREAGANGGVVALTCPASGRCRAGAAYVDAHGNYQAYVVAETAHRWARGTTLALPRGSSDVGVDGGVYGLVCASTSRCSATGSYLDATGNYQGFAASLG
jgi:hypothetical protein